MFRSWVISMPFRSFRLDLTFIFPCWSVCWVLEHSFGWVRDVYTPVDFDNSSTTTNIQRNTSKTANRWWLEVSSRIFSLVLREILVWMKNDEVTEVSTRSPARQRWHNVEIGDENSKRSTAFDRRRPWPRIISIEVVQLIQVRRCSSSNASLFQRDLLETRPLKLSPSDDEPLLGSEQSTSIVQPGKIPSLAHWSMRAIVFH